MVNSQTVDKLRDLFGSERGLLFQDVLTVLSVESASAESIAKTLWRNHHPVSGADVRAVLQELGDLDLATQRHAVWVISNKGAQALDVLLPSI